jgi:hypothetical protein
MASLFSSCGTVTEAGVMLIPSQTLASPAPPAADMSTVAMISLEAAAAVPPEQGSRTCSGVTVSGGGGAVDGTPAFGVSVAEGDGVGLGVGDGVGDGVAEGCCVELGVGCGVKVRDGGGWGIPGGSGGGTVKTGGGGGCAGGGMPATRT